MNKIKSILDQHNWTPTYEMAGPWLLIAFAICTLNTFGIIGSVFFGIVILLHDIECGRRQAAYKEHLRSLYNIKSTL